MACFAKDAPLPHQALGAETVQRVVALTLASRSPEKKARERPRPSSFPSARSRRNLVTPPGLKALEAPIAAARAAYHAAQQIEDLNERRNAIAASSRDMRYLSERLRTAQLVPDPVERDMVAFGSRATFARDDGRGADVPDRRGG